MWTYLLLSWLWSFNLVVSVRGAPIDGASDVTSPEGPPDLTPVEFDQMAGTHFVKFFSPYCPHCAALAPKWTAAYEATAGRSAFKWANVNCIENGDLCSTQNVFSYPTLRIYRDGQRIYDYGNPGATEQDLEVFALEFAKRGDAALSEAFEKATPELIAEVKAFEAVDSGANSGPISPIEETVENAHTGEKEPRVDAASDSAPKGDSLAEGERPSGGDAANAATAPVVKSLVPSDFGLDNNVGRWFILFVGPDCEECEAMKQKWDRHENFARDIPEINWGRADCSEHSSLCQTENIVQVPSMRIYQDGMYLYEYTGAKDTMSLRTFLKRAAVLSDFNGFSLNDLDVSAVGFDGKPLPEGAGPNQEPNYMSGPTVPKPQYNGKGKPAIADVVKYTLDTLGQPIDEDPGLLIFGESPEQHHNFRTWGAPNAQPPAYFAENAAASYSMGKVKELKGTELEEIVKRSGEPWFIKFYSPKCPHCQALEPVFEEFAKLTKGKLNAGAVNCEINAKLCEAEKITHYPFMKYYRGPVALDEYTGPRTVDGLTEYAVKVAKAQIAPIENYDQLTQEILYNFDKNLTTFVYLYDASVMTEDWVSLMKVAINIAEWGGKLYRSDSPELREMAGIKHRGTAFVLVDALGIPPDATLKWYDFPLSNIPAKIRDSKLVSEWAHHSKWSQLQPLEPIQQSEYASYVAVKIVSGNAPVLHEDTEIMAHKQLGHEMREFYKERQINDQNRMRIDRLRQHDAALRQSKFKYALSLMKQKIEAPFIADLAFAYVPIRLWQTNFAKYVDVSHHKVGDVVIMDFYHGIYVDEFNLVAIQDDRQVFDDLVEFLHRYEAHDSKAVFTSIRHFKTKLSGVPMALHRTQKFHAVQLDHKNGSLTSSLFLIFKVVGGLVLFYIFYRTVIRPQLRAFIERYRGSDSGPSLLPKQE